MQTDFGRLAACFSTSGESFCVVQILQHMDCFGAQLYNEYDCPLLTLTPCPSFHCVFYHCISHSVSFAYECSSTCIFRKNTSTSIIERQPAQSRSKLCFHNDFSNNLYALNVYCMHVYQ